MAFRKVTSGSPGGLEQGRGRGKKKRTLFQAEGTACAKAARQGTARCFNLAAACWERMIRGLGSRPLGSPGPRIYSKDHGGQRLSIL